VYDEDNTTLLFFVASRGHHADIGGISPGSMPAESRSIMEEGILLDNLRIVRDYQLDEQLLRKVLGSGDYPARKIGQNIADLRAQLAANHQGISEVHKLVREFGREVVTRYTNFALDNAEAMVRDVIGTLTDGEHECTIDNGARIHVSARIDKAGLATIDFTGSSDQLDSNFNAPASVCRAAVLYVFRCLVDKDIPLNEGCLRPLKVIIPEHSCINPEYPAAVVAGNVETSQVIVDCLFAALGKQAASHEQFHLWHR
jgi:5-oxoprolinase (ATP-hydrolysing)